MLASGSKQGYAFNIAGISASQFYITDVPEVSGQAHSFYSDEDGIICFSNLTNVSTPKTHTGAACPSGFTDVE